MGISSHFPPISLPFLSHFLQPPPATTLHNPHPVCYARYYPISPQSPPPPIFPICPHFLHFPHSPRFFQTPKSWFGELVSSVAMSADACLQPKHLICRLPLSATPAVLPSALRRG